MLLFTEMVIDIFGGSRDLKAYLVARLIRLLHLKRFWYFQTSCAKEARYWQLDKEVIWLCWCSRWTKFIQLTIYKKN